MTNMILNTDSYKYSHEWQYPEDVKYISSYIESRGGEYERIVFFGLQMFLKEYLSKPITMADVNEAEAIVLAHGEPFNRAGWEYIVNKHGGLFPLYIQALPEGSVVAPHIPQVQVMNTDPNCRWAVSHIETSLIRGVWYPSSVATRSYAGKRIIKGFLEKNADNIEGLPFKLHDFGARGVSSNESAGLGGAAHLVNFMGTDTVQGLVYAQRYYNATVAGFSIPAAEHSTITSWSEENEAAAYKNMLTQFSGPGKLVAVVSDSYNIWNAIDNIWGGTLKEDVEKNEGVLVIRPDSGDPVQTPIQVIERLGSKFGKKLNTKGYKMLPDNIRVIQGDGVNLDSIKRILTLLDSRGWSADNIAFGMGGELLQKPDRDTLKYAMKCNAVSADGVIWKDVYKKPVNDPSKASKAGRQAVIKKVNGYTWFESMRENEFELRSDVQYQALEDVWLNGELLRDTNFDEVRANAAL
jgi:nicotinamide phosphoribosyltransferase